MHVPVEDEAAVVDLSIKVDRQLRDTGDWLVDVDQCRGAVGGDDAAGDTEVAIQPAVQQRAAVHLDAEQLPIGDGLVSMGMDAQPRRVGVCADDAYTARHAVGPTPGHEGTAAPGETGGRQRRPRLRLGEFDESAGDEQPGCRLGGVPWRR